MYNSTVLTENLQRIPSSHHVTVTGQQFCMGSARAEQYRFTESLGVTEKGGAI